jgi:trimeric autotransporter adhesin
MSHQKITTIMPAFLTALLLLTVLAFPVSAITLTPGGSLSSSATISNGDSVFINGIATGHPQQGLHVWIIGPNYLKVSTVSVNADNSYSFELRPADTQELAPGQYFAVVQHPMMNGRFDINYDAATGRVTNQQLGNSGTTIFQLSGAGSLQSTDAAAAIVRAISSQNVDDTFAPVAFTIRVPDALIDPIGDRVVGDKFTIAGSTNLAVGDDLMIEVYSSSFHPTTKSQSGEFSGASGVVKVVPGSGGLNRWSFNVDTSAWKPDEYSVTVTGVTITVTGSTLFSLVQATPVPTSTITAFPTPTGTPTLVPTTVPTPLPTPTKSPVPIVGVIGVLGFLVIVRQGMK